MTHEPQDALMDAYERLRQHALHPGTVVGIDSLVVLVRHGVAQWASAVDLSRLGRTFDERCGAAFRTACGTPHRWLAVPTEGVAQQAMFEVFLAMLLAHGEGQSHGR